MSCGPRSLRCPACKKEFSFNPRGSDGSIKLVQLRPQGVKTKAATIAWTDLKRGDKIKIVGGSGPYYTTDAGEKIQMGECGVFFVNAVMQDGLMAKSKAGETAFIYMGPDRPMPTGTFYKAHTISKVKRL